MFAHDHDEAYNEYKHDQQPLWDGNSGDEDDAPEDAGRDAGFGRGAASPGAGRDAKAGIHTGWVYGAVIFALVAITAVTVLLFLSSGHLTESGKAPESDGDNRPKSVNSNSAGVSNSPKAHSQLEVSSSVHSGSFLEELGQAFE